MKQLIQLSGLWLFTVLSFSGCEILQKAAKPESPFRVAFYNVENLFDLEDDPLTFDEEFTPGGAQEWTKERYETKLERIAQVVEGMQYPVLLGVAEVENRQVLEDLCEETSLDRYDYELAHFDSPDARGIDVGLLFQERYFRVLDKESVRISFPEEVIPDEPGYTTRDILVVKGVLGEQDTVHVMVVHFPSRRGGVEESQPKRIYVATQLRAKVDEIFAVHPGANIIIMGDFNDEPDNSSVAETLGAQQLDAPPRPASLYNGFSELDAIGEGSYNYRGNWNMLDQIIFSSSFFDGKGNLTFSKAGVYRADYMMYEDKKYGQRPNRTYGGDRYFGGYSDHLPVYAEIRMERK